MTLGFCDTDVLGILSKARAEKCKDGKIAVVSENKHAWDPDFTCWRTKSSKNVKVQSAH